jgi:two-component system sensor histidine kinase KdpD
MIAFVFSCFVVGRVAERARQQTRNAENRRGDVERLYALSQEMMLHEDAAGLVREIPRLVEKNFALDAVALYLRDEDQVHASIPNRSGRPKTAGTPESLSTTSENAEEDGLEGGTPDRREELRVALRAIASGQTEAAELANGYSPMNLVFGMQCVGTLAWKPATLSREVATSVAAQVAIAITRAHAIEANARMEAARAADKLRTALIDSLTHELRTPLTAIRAAASTLVDGFGLDEESRTELAEIVDEESSRLDALIGEAMEMAEIDADGVRVRLEPIHPETFLEDAVEESRDLLAQHEVTIHVEPSDLPGRPSVLPTVLPTIWLDPHLIGRVLRHLLENAARYTPLHSKIVVRCYRASEKMWFAVEDEGMGIDPHDLPMIFEKFYRGRRIGLSRNSGKNASKGSGMGLAIVRAILTAHGGAIDVESVVGQGTKFRFWVPVVEKQAVQESASVDQGSGSS